MIKQSKASLHPGTVLKGLYLGSMEVNIAQAANQARFASLTNLITPLS